MGKQKEIQEFVGKDIYSMDVRFNQHSADVFINFVKTDENGEKIYGQAVIDPYWIAEIFNEAGLLFTAEKAIKNFHVKKIMNFLQEGNDGWTNVYRGKRSC